MEEMVAVTAQFFGRVWQEPKKKGFNINDNHDMAFMAIS
jgi:hypothetical protein